jgi:DNA primase
MIPQSFIQDLLGRVDIVEVVEAAVPLKRAGANLVACCPFHSEKSPSFTVSPTKQFYHCFGCGAHGTAISFMMEYHGLGFVEAVKDLAARTGMTVPAVEQSGFSHEAHTATAQLTDVLAAAARYFKDSLRGSEDAIRYLKGRGVSGEIAARFGIGYAPAGWQNLEAIFPDYANDATLVEAGLVIRAEEGRRYDRFRDRVMFPIVSTRGDIIGFGGRVLGQGEPKYLNSPETPVFEKGRELYGLFQARRAIREANRVIVVEGYMDVVALAQHGVANAVATLGTATTPFHVQKLLRQADHVTFCFDGDAAGRRAAWRALETSLEALSDGKHVNFLFLPEKDDPDTWVRAHGSEAFVELVERAEPLSAFMLRELRAGPRHEHPGRSRRLPEEGRGAAREDRGTQPGARHARCRGEGGRCAGEQSPGACAGEAPGIAASGVRTRWSAAPQRAARRTAPGRSRPRSARRAPRSSSARGQRRGVRGWVRLLAGRCRGRRTPGGRHHRRDAAGGPPVHGIARSR